MFHSAARAPSRIAPAATASTALLRSLLPQPVSASGAAVAPRRKLRTAATASSGFSARLRRSPQASDFRQSSLTVTSPVSQGGCSAAKFRTLGSSTVSSASEKARASPAKPKKTSGKEIKGKSAAISGNGVTIEWTDGCRSRYHGIWLRDHCHCPDCHHPETRQRLLNTLEIALDIKPKSVKLIPQEDDVEIVWDTKDEHVTVYDLAWLRHHSYDPPLKTTTEIPRLIGEKTLWDDEFMAKGLPITDFKEVMQSDEGLAKWLRNIETFGVAFVDNVPISKEDTERLARRICFVRESHYGGFWDFTANLAHHDLAYTTYRLGAHTDTTYFTDPVGLQMFHLLEFDGQGGESLFVDGFNVAEQLRQKNPAAFAALSTIPVAVHSAGDAATLVVPTPQARPILSVDPATDSVVQVRYNNEDRSPLSATLCPGLTPSSVESFYAALREWSSLLQDRKNELWTQLRPGRVAIFDNWRVLHGRAAFSGHRRLIGCYLNWDDYRSRVRTIAGEGGAGGLERWQL